VLYLCFKFS